MFSLIQSSVYSTEGYYRMIAFVLFIVYLCILKTVATFVSMVFAGHLQKYAIKRLVGRIFDIVVFKLDSKF